MRADPNRDPSLLDTSLDMPAARRYDAVLWDFDGVIARTERLHTVAWHRTLRNVGIDYPRSAFDTAAVDDDRDLIARTFENLGVSLHASQVLAWCAAKQAILVELLESAPPIYRHVPETMRSLASLGYRQAIVTSTWRANVKATLKASGLLDLMEFVIAKEDVSRPKPAPDGYLLAVGRLRFAPKRCLAIEDSPTGLKSAMAAGIDVVALAHPHSPAQSRKRPWTSGAPLIDDLTGIDRILGHAVPG